MKQQVQCGSDVSAGIGFKYRIGEKGQQAQMRKEGGEHNQKNKSCAGIFIHSASFTLGKTLGRPGIEPGTLSLRGRSSADFLPMSSAYTNLKSLKCLYLLYSGDVVASIEFLELRRPRSNWGNDKFTST